MVALGGWTWSNNFAEVAKDAGKREVFGQSVKEFLEEWGLDGIGKSFVQGQKLNLAMRDHADEALVDIDWEYPTAERVGGTPEGTACYTTVLQRPRSSY